MHILFLDSNRANLLHLSVFVPFFQIIGCLLFGFLIRGPFRFLERQKLLPYIKIDFFNLCKSSLLLGSNALLEDRMLRFLHAKNILVSPLGVCLACLGE